MNKKTQGEIDLALMQKDISYIKDSVKDMSRKLEEEYATKMELNSKVDPVIKIGYALLLVVLTAVLYAVLNGVLK
jgi:hypothetical protein